MRLTDLAHIPTPPHRAYSLADLDAARRYQESRGLRYDMRRACFDRDGLVSRWSDWTPGDNSPEAILEREFMPVIINSASRKARGFSF